MRREDGKQIRNFANGSAWARDTDELGVVLFKDSLEHRRRPVLCGVNLLNQAIDVRGHHKQVSNRFTVRIPVSMRRSPWHKHRRTRARFNFIRSNLHPQSPVKDVPRFIVMPVKVQGSDRPR